MKKFFIIPLVSLSFSIPAFATKHKTAFFPTVTTVKDECFNCPCLDEGEKAFKITSSTFLYIDNVYTTATGKLITITGADLNPTTASAKAVARQIYSWSSSSYFRASPDALRDPEYGSKGNFYGTVKGYLFYADFVD